MALVSSPVPAQRLMGAIGLIGGTAALIASKLLFR